MFFCIDTVSPLGGLFWGTSFITEKHNPTILRDLTLRGVVWNTVISTYRLYIYIQHPYPKTTLRPQPFHILDGVVYALYTASFCYYPLPNAMLLNNQIIILNSFSGLVPLLLMGSITETRDYNRDKSNIKIWHMQAYYENDKLILANI